MTHDVILVSYCYCWQLLLLLATVFGDVRYRHTEASGEL